MKLGEILKDVGEGVGKVAKRAGGVLEPIAERTAEVVSGQAPQLDAEQRRHAEKLEDQALAQKAAVLENNLAMGQKYGTLTPQQQQQYVDEISNLYSHPRHSRTLMEKLRKAIHPEGAVYTAPEAALPNATPAGGTFQQEEQAKEAAEARKLADTLTAIDRRADDAAKAKAGQKKAVPGVRPFTDPRSGKSYQPMQDAEGNITNEEIPNYVPPPPKSLGSVPNQYAALLAKSLLAKSGKGPQLTDAENAQMQGLQGAMTLPAITRAQAMAKYSAMYNLTQTQDPATGADILVPRMDAVTAARGGNPLLGSKGSPRAMLAASALQQIHTIKNLLDNNPDLVGPFEGRANAIERMGGVQSPEFARFQAAALYLAEHGSGVFGARNIKTVRDLESAITDPAFNADAMKAALDQSEITNEMFLNPQGSTPPATPNVNRVKPIVPKLPNAGGKPAWSVPADAPPAPKADGKFLKDENKKVIAISRGGQWANPNGQ